MAAAILAAIALQVALACHPGADCFRPSPGFGDRCSDPDTFPPCNISTDNRIDAHGYEYRDPPGWVNGQPSQACLALMAAAPNHQISSWACAQATAREAGR